MKLNNKIFAADQFTYLELKPYVIAEAGVNHGGNLELAKNLITDAALAGANAIKFQSYKAEFLAAKDSPAYWDLTKESTRSQYELFKKYDSFGKNEFEILKEYCVEKRIDFLSTPFDIESAKYLNGMMDVFKISSSDITNKPFIEEICAYGKPVILSTGASDIDEISEAINWIDECNVPVALLHCVLNYPTINKNANLGMITDLRKTYPNRIIGYSDHTLPGRMDNLLTACLLGATIIEKHFTCDKTLPGNDHYHSMDKDDLTLFLSRLNGIRESVGGYKKKSLSSEELSRRNARRSLVAACKILKSQKIEKNHLTWKRPATGISPKYIDGVIGRVANRDIEADEIISDDLLV